LLAELGARTFSETFAADNTPEDMAAYLASAFSLEQQAAGLANPRCLFLIAETVLQTSDTMHHSQETLFQTGEPSNVADRVARGYAMLRSGKVPSEITGKKPMELVRLYVSRESLGGGVGAALMRACIGEAMQRGHKTLWLGVWEHNHRAQSFYRKWNFHEMGTHVFQLGDDPQTDILMQRSVSE
jgi:ribosomal protein S18 acetylase RimI-like enzyme